MRPYVRESKLDRWAVASLKAPLDLYRYLISPMLGPRCRYLPTCSEYATQALEAHGALKGGGLAVRRVLRCHPWGGEGFDPVPASANKRGADAA